MSWIFDEDIAKPAYDKFIKAGINGWHVSYDLKKSGTDDDKVIDISRKRQATVITLNAKHFWEKSNEIIRTSPGVWMMDTQDPEEQVKLVKEASKTKELNTKKLRFGKKVYLRKNTTEIVDCKTGNKSVLKVNKK